jgi:diguanylate cyclase
MPGKPLLQPAASKAGHPGALQDEFQRTGAHAEGAISLIRTLRLPATPRIYELCYAYATGEYPTVNHAINELLKSRTAVGDATMMQIAARYVSPGDMQDELHSVGERVASEINRVLGSLDSMTSAIGRCSDDIARAAQTSADSGEPDKLVDDIKELLRSSTKIDAQQRRLEAALETSNAEIAGLREDLGQIRSMTGSDPLTGLPNRQQFRPLLAKALGDSVANGVSLCVATGDINEFSAFNESWGYDRGDQVLRLVASEMKQKVGPWGTVVRSGGAQFALILTGAPMSEAASIADRICRAVMQREVKIRSTGQMLGRVGMSFGIAGARPHDTEDTLEQRARACLRAAKRRGRGLVVCDDDPALAGEAA